MALLPDADDPISEQIHDLADRWVCEAERQRDAYKTELDQLRERLLIRSLLACMVGCAFGVAFTLLIILAVT